MTAKLKDGTEIPVEVTSVLLDGGSRSFVVVRDLTERKRAEAALRGSEERFRMLVEQSVDGIFVGDAQGHYLDVNAAGCEMLGYSREEILSRTIADVVAEEEVHRIAPEVARFADGRVVRSEWRFRRKDGSFFIGEVVGRQLPDGRLLGIARDITERKRAEEALAAAKASAEHAQAIAEQANRAKDHFLAVLSHELRTPLTPVVMGVSMLQDRMDLDPSVREMLEMIGRSVDMEARLIDDLLDVSRIARGKIELHRQRIDLCAVIQQAVEVCKPEIEAGKFRLNVDLGPAVPYWVEADPSRLQQVFWNLLKNAIKFTPHGGRIGIRCRPGHDYVVVEVIDSGIGIEPEALVRVFNAFEQAERSITRQFGGLGLGLTISKALVEMHSGTIEARSEGRGKGATFRVRLPLTSPAAALPGGGSGAAPAASAGHAAFRLRVLLVEDHPITAMLLRNVLTACGHAVHWAADETTALEMADLQEFDLLISDLGLPDGSGHDLMQQLRQRGYKLPGIALSGYGQEDDIRRSQQAGFAVHLTKPASREAVIEAIASVTAVPQAAHAAPKENGELRRRARIVARGLAEGRRRRPLPPKPHPNLLAVHSDPLCFQAPGYG